MLILLLDAVSVLIHTPGFLLLLALVSLSVEPDEEDEVKTAVEHQDEVEADREAAGRMDEGHDPMNKHHDELDQLHRGEVAARGDERSQHGFQCFLNVLQLGLGRGLRET